MEKEFAKNAVEILTDACQLLDGKKIECPAWSDWDSDVRNRISWLLQKITPYTEEREDAEWVFDRTCPECEKNGRGEGMLCRDKFGIWCVISGCGWKEN
jgi:hypothetical protein